MNYYLDEYTHMNKSASWYDPRTWLYDPVGDIQKRNEAQRAKMSPEVRAIMDEQDKRMGPGPTTNVTASDYGAAWGDYKKLFNPNTALDPVVNKDWGDMNGMEKFTTMTGRGAQALAAAGAVTGSLAAMPFVATAANAVGGQATALAARAGVSTASRQIAQKGMFQGLRAASNAQRVGMAASGGVYLAASELNPATNFAFDVADNYMPGGDNPPAPSPSTTSSTPAAGVPAPYQMRRNYMSDQQSKDFNKQYMANRPPAQGAALPPASPAAPPA